MAGEDWSNRDLIFANFQAASGLDDYEQCISILELNNWDLQTSLNTVFTEYERENQQVVRASRNSPSDVGDVQEVDLDPDRIDFCKAKASVTSEKSSSIKPRQLLFNVLWHERTISICINDNETIGALKKMLEIQTGLPKSEINLEGWTVGNSRIRNSTVLSSLHLSSETHLVLHSPSKVTVSPAVYVPCNIPECRPRKDSYTFDDFRPRVIDVDFPEESSCSSGLISLTVNYEGRDYRLKYKPNQTIKDVKQELYILTKIPTYQQQWFGWPYGADDHSCLGSLDLSRPDHILLISAEKVGFSPSTVITTNSLEGLQNWDSGMADSPEITDLDEQIISDDDISYFESSQSQKKRPLLASDSLDTSDTLIQFQRQFEERYGDFHPAFFIGSLKDAIEEAAGQSADERRPLLIYLHHDKSILANIFCSQVLCSEQFVSFASQNCIIWPWDMSQESNRQRFFNLLVQHVGNMASTTVSKFRDNEYPLLLIVMKSKAGLEVCSVLHGNGSLDELMTSLINGYEVFEQAKLVEVKAERERQEREAMKLEQDTAYLESLAADRAKVEAEKLRAQQEVEKFHQEQLSAKLKEAERMSCEEQLPAEPEKTAKDITNILFRFPNSERVARRFKETDKLKVVFMYVVSKGFSLSEHRIVTNFPRKELNEGSSEKTLKELQLCPQGTLFVEEQ